jgi:hypothetical protein
MTTYKILASRETYYEFEIEADSEKEALEVIEQIEINEDVEKYAYDWYPLEVFDTEEIEEDK